ncbi:MAG TPA: EAL domain-containing protein [Streptosporangiaceae bacterium]|nr:EAL domain-containing protein [Streptosporangiaceae bacterium]
MKDAHDSRNIGPRFGTPLWLYMTAVSAAGIVVLGIGVYWLSRLHLIEQLRLPMFWVVGGMILGGEIWRIATPGRPWAETAAASRSITLGVLLFWGFPIAVMLRAIAVVVGGVAQRHTPHRIIFNASQLSLSLGAAELVLLLFRASPYAHHPWSPRDGKGGVLLLAALAYFALNFTMVAMAHSLRTRSPIKSVLKANLRYQIAASVVLFATAPLVTVAMATGSPIIVALFAFPLATIYVSAAMSVQREHQANHDELTGLVNRKLLAKRGNEALARAAAIGTGVGLLLIDLDRSTGLKQVNDTLGHAVGDRLLQIVAHRLVVSSRPGDVVARLGGDEFAVLLPSVKEPAVAREVASRLRAALAEPVRLETIIFEIQASIGIAVYPEDAGNFDQLIQRSDVAMYVAKERSSGIERYDAEYDRNSADRLAMLGDLRGTIQRHEIELYFQPKIRLSDGQVIGMEALARWPHPRRGVLTASDFVGLAEQSHLMSELTEQVIDKALTQAAKWWQSGMPIQVCVNLPARDLLGGRLVDLIRQALRRYGLPPESLGLDIDEQVLAGKAAQAAATIQALADLGVGVSLDDFGTGYSSLAQLTGLGVSEVKLDPALVRGLPDSADHSVTVKSLVRLAASLGIRSIGEGVESDTTATALRLLGCDGAQGWHFARPLNALMASEWLTEHYSPEPAAASPPGGAEQKVRDVGGAAASGLAAAASAVPSCQTKPRKLNQLA